MKNTNNYTLKTCIFMLADNYERLIRHIMPNVKTEITLEGIDYYKDDDSNITDENVNEALSKHFDTTVTSVHIDQCDMTGVWITYKKEEKET